MSTKTASKPTPSVADRRAAQKVADDSAERVKKMSKSQRRRLIAKHNKETARIEELRASYAPTAESAGSDLLPVLQAIGLEFFRRYYPDATHASFHASCYKDKGMPEYSVMFPIPCEPRRAQETADKGSADAAPTTDLLEKDVEKAFAIWYATARSWMDQILNSARGMVARIKGDRSCVLGGMFSDNDLENLDKFQGALLDTSTMLNDVYPLVGKLMIDPVDVMGEDKKAETES
jgi:hypothetical protein